MTPKDEEKDFLAIGLANELAYKGLAFKFNLSFGTFTFSMDTTGTKVHPAHQKRARFPSF